MLLPLAIWEQDDTCHPANALLSSSLTLTFCPTLSVKMTKSSLVAELFSFPVFFYADIKACKMVFEINIYGFNSRKCGL